MTPRAFAFPFLLTLSLLAGGAFDLTNSWMGSQRALLVAIALAQN